MLFIATMHRFDGSKKQFKQTLRQLFQAASPDSAQRYIEQTHVKVGFVVESINEATLEGVTQALGDKAVNLDDKQEVLFLS